MSISKHKFLGDLMVKDSPPFPNAEDMGSIPG